jgi:hypothetical protein
MDPFWGKMQQQTDWRALSGDIPFNKRFDPEGPYEQAFEAGGWDVLKGQLDDEKKKRVQQRAAYPPILHDMLRYLPSYLKEADKNNKPFSIVARPWENY